MKYLLRPSLCASLDILGFQDEINRAYDEKRELKLLEQIKETLKAASDYLEDFHRRNSHMMTTLRFFTDNVIIGYGWWTEGAKGELSELCHLLADFQLNMACRGLFIRGGISIGTLASDERVVFGDCLVKAHELEAKVAKNPRVVLDSCFGNQDDVVSEGSAHCLMRDVDGKLFVNYLSELIHPKFMPPRLDLNLDEDRLKIHKGQIERLLEEKRNDPNVWSKYFWAANYHDAFCDQTQRKLFKIDESLLRAQPVGLVKNIAVNTW